MNKIKIGQEVRVVKPYETVPELAGKVGRVVAFDAKPLNAFSEPWVLVAFSVLDAAGLMLHDGRGRADREIGPEYQCRCWFLPECALVTE